ncbi:uncharacterized protein K02A2.6-like [Anopheles ziemanni]|uniref:uncharacterized protein K02A2.6-like n=1 Tax=Anopheles coustani TaxID=139045 RepID=UPI00265A570A|nr:uncharacterized protein K02A2.6-like [Anopheles coustani]XP_058170776.1 uncharacterized protein K02A2.6-like [Anopheles ziemanni]
MVDRTNNAGSAPNTSSNTSAETVAGTAPPPNFGMEPFDRRKSKWLRWVDRLETAFEIYGVTAERVKRNYLLHYMGTETYDVICDKVAPDAPRDRTYDQIVTTLNEFYSPQPLEIAENYKFNSRRQGDKDATSAEESVDEYLVALRRMAASCNFGDYLEKALRNQLVFGIKRSDIRDRLLERRTLTLQEARDIAVGMELSRKGRTEIEGCAPKQDMHAVYHPPGKGAKKPNRAERPNTSSEKPSCYRCGDKSHLANTCKHKNTVCSCCKTKGHLAKVCLKKKKMESRDTTQTHHVESVKIREVFTVCAPSHYKKLWLNVTLNQKIIKFEVDTGSPVSIMSEEHQRRLFPNAQLRESGTSLVSYCNTPIVVRGILDVEVQLADKTMLLPLYVTKSNKHPLVGREWLVQMEIDWQRLVAESVNTVEPDVNHHATDCKAVLERYPKVFEASIGRISNMQAHLRLRENTRPVFLKARKLPFNMIKMVEDELEKLVQEGVLSKVDSSSWATPIVPIRKAHNRVRICGDYKQTVNPNLVVDRHPLPTIDELFASLAGGKKFSKIDLVQAYLQLEVAPEDREILTLSTHRGLYRPNRLMYGIASAPAIWQRQIEVILQGIEGVSVFLDDIKITGDTEQKHLRRLEEVLSRLNERGIRVNREKCQFFADKIEYCGYLIDANGIHKIQKKVEAIQQMPTPKNREEVRSFVGLINYYGRFLQNLSTILYPLNNLLKQDVPFQWNKQCNDSFKRVKEQVQSEKCLVHYTPELPVLLATDASPYGVGAVLSHVYPDGSERPIQFASQTLNRVQQKYMQVDKEAYAIVFGVRKFFQYLYGRKFTLLTDNQAITKIFAEQKGLPVMSALRMQHYATFLQSFEYNIRFRKSADHANADAMSRMPLNTIDPEDEMEESDAIELNQIETLPLTAMELENAVAKDKQIQKLLQGIRHSRAVDAQDRFGIDQQEFTIQKGCLLRGIRVYIPPSLRRKVLEELHSAHFGTTRTKSLARGYCWWPGMDQEIERMVANCTDCQSVKPEPAKANLHCWETPSAPFQRVHVDFAGPFMDKYFFIYVDAFSKWPEVKICKSITAEHTVNMCRELFSTFGIPSVIVSDHGVQFTSVLFKEFLKMNGVVHKMGAPYHPATNGQAERYVQTIKNKLKAVKCSKSQIHLELCNILLTYRKTIHPATGKSPSMLVFGRQIRSRLDLMLPTSDKSNKEGLEVRQFQVGDRVRVRDFLSHDKWKFGRIAERVGKLRYNVHLDDGRIWERHIDHISEVGADLQGTAKDTGAKSDHQRGDIITNPEEVFPSASSKTATATTNTTSDAEKTDVGTLPVSERETDIASEQIKGSDGGNSPEPEPDRSDDFSGELNVRRSSRTKKPPQRLNL